MDMLNVRSMIWMANKKLCDPLNENITARYGVHAIKPSMVGTGWRAGQSL